MASRGFYFIFGARCLAPNVGRGAREQGTAWTWSRDPPPGRAGLAACAMHAARPCSGNQPSTGNGKRLQPPIPAAAFVRDGPSLNSTSRSSLGLAFVHTVLTSLQIRTRTTLTSFSEPGDPWLCRSDLSGPLSESCARLRCPAPPCRPAPPRPAPRPLRTAHPR